MLIQVLSQENKIHETDIQGLIDGLSIVLDLTPNSIYWFRPYIALDFPEVTCDKKYFFLYGTDHDAGGGGIWWGKGDNLDCSDFEELGLIISGYQAETPYLYRFTNNLRKIHLYYHTATSEPGNGGIQQTRLRTTTGGLLHAATWVDEGRPLGSEVGDQHTGYLKFWNINGLKAIHYKQGAYLPSFTGVWQNSIIAQDGLSVTRGLYYDDTLNIEVGRRIVPTFGWFFEKYGQVWWIGINKPVANWTKFDNNLILCKADDDLSIIEQIRILNYGVLDGAWGVFISSDIAHLYHVSSNRTIQYGTLDLIQLQLYL